MAQSEENKTSAVAKAVSPFVPEAFDIPRGIETAEFRLRMLTVNDVVKDYDAVMSSREHLLSLNPGSTWPEGLTLEQNLIDLGWHQKEFQRRSSFTYTVVSLDESRVLGCVYIYPSTRVGFDAEVYLWARQSELGNGLEQRLYETVSSWLNTQWPFEAVAFPRRSISQSEWDALPRQ